MVGRICNHPSLFFSIFNFKELNSKLSSCEQGQIILGSNFAVRELQRKKKDVKYS